MKQMSKRVGNANLTRAIALGRRISARALRCLADEFFDQQRCDDDPTAGQWSAVVERIRAVDTTLATDADSVKGEACWTGEERSFLAGLHVGMALMGNGGAR